MLTRIRGKVGVLEEPEEFAGKYACSVWICEFGSGDVDESNPDIGPLGPFDTEQEAKETLQAVAQKCCEMMEEKFTGKVSGEYIDMGTNRTRKWDKSDEN